MDTLGNETEPIYEDGPLVNLRTCFYLLLPHETYSKTVDDVPPLIARAVPVGFVLIVLEYLVLASTGRKKEWRLHSSVVSWSSTAMYDAFNFFFLKGLEFSIYQWVFDNYRMFTLPWNSFYTYLFSLITVEFCSYWWHRMGHELAIMWAAHELHHNSDDFNLSVAFRNCAVMRLFRWTFYLPLAFFGMPTSIMITHLTLGSIYNGAIHYHAVPKLGKVIPGIGDAIEYIFVTPSHHRVHHASNQYCIDKNYGQYVILWDRLFGTFVEEKEDEPLVFGTLTQPNSYDMAKLQVSPFVKLWAKVQSMDNFGDKMRALFYGPGWFPGTPRLGIYEDIPDVRGRKKYDPSYPLWMSVYLTVNAFCMFYLYLNMATRVKTVSHSLRILNLAYIFFGYAAVGGLYDKQRYSVALELSRIVTFLGLYHTIPMLTENILTTFVFYVQYADLLLWPFIAVYIYSIKDEDKDTMINYNEIQDGKVAFNGSVTSEHHSRDMANGNIQSKFREENIVQNGKVKVP